MGEDAKVLGEGVKGFGEGFGSKSGSGEAKAEHNEGRVEGKGRQNVVFGHNRPFQKTSETGGGQNAGTSSWAFAADYPKLWVTSDSGRVVE